MLKYVLAGLFILILTGLLQHPVPIIEDIEVYSEQTILEPIEETNTIEQENELYLPQANIKKSNSKSTDYYLNDGKSILVSVTFNTYYKKS